MPSYDLPQPPRAPVAARLPPPPPILPGAPTRPYRSGRTLATVVRALFALTIVVAGFDLAANVDAAQLLGRLEADAGAVSLAQLDAS